jgi:hypothetical protein
MATSTRAHGKICYLEIPATDIAVSADFYCGVLAGRSAPAATEPSLSMTASAR